MGSCSLINGGKGEGESLKGDAIGILKQVKANLRRSDADVIGGIDMSLGIRSKVLIYIIMMYHGLNFGVWQVNYYLSSILCYSQALPFDVQCDEM